MEVEAERCTIRFVESFEIIHEEVFHAIYVGLLRTAVDHRAPVSTTKIRGENLIYLRGRATK